MDNLLRAIGHLLLAKVPWLGYPAPLSFRQFLTTRFGRGSKNGNFQTEMDGKFGPKSVVNFNRNDW
jgi:hypothetical protein